MKVNDLLKKIVTILFSAFFIFIYIVSGQASLSAFNTYASETSKDPDNTSVIEDLDSINFDYSLYMPNPLGSYDLIYFAEHAYSTNTKQTYDLYLYVYNPALKEIDTLSGLHTAKMAVLYDSKGMPSGWENVRLKYLNQSDTGLFVKFKVLEPLRIHTQVSYYESKFECRRYDVSGLELKDTSSNLPIDSGVQKGYEYRGYAANCNGNTVSTLSCKKVDSIESVNLEVNYTTWRSNVVNHDYKDDFYVYGYDSLTTAYFALPDDYVKDSVTLKKIKAAWYEYKTDLIFALLDNVDGGAFDDEIKAKIGQVVSSNKDDNNYLNYQILWYYLGTDSGYGYSYNTTNGLLNNINRIDWAFSISEDDNMTDGVYRVSSEKMLDYMNWYSKKFSANEDDLILDKYHKELFVDSIDEDRIQYLYANENKSADEWVDTSGYMLREIDVDKDLIDLKVLDDSNFWREFWGYTKAETIKPIEILTDEILLMTEEEFEERYYVDCSNCGSGANVFEDCKKMIREGYAPVLFRFADTEYFVDEFYADNLDNIWFTREPDGFVAQETVFLNFDVISLSFLNDGEEYLTVIPVTANPVDIVPGIDYEGELGNFGDEFNWGKVFLTIVLIAVILFLLYTFFPSLIKGILSGLIWLISLPFKWIGALFKKNKGKKK